MKRIFALLSITLFLLSSCGTNKNINKIIFDKNVDQKILVGKIDRKGLMKKPFKSWFTEEYNSYELDETAITHLKKYVAENTKIIIVLATWCPDSRREVPRFYKILDEIEFDENRVTVYAVDRNFEAANEDISELNIKKVPTFIYQHHNYEAGRIIETPSLGSLEKDLVRFTQSKGQ